MKRIKIIILAGLLIIFVGIIFSGKIAHIFFQEENKSFVENIKGDSVSQKIFLTINQGDENILDFESDFESGMNAFDFLANKTKETNISLETQKYDSGIFIQAIGNKKNGDEGKYWLYYINGETPMVSADKYLLKVGDNVEFKFEKSPF